MGELSAVPEPARLAEEINEQHRAFVGNLRKTAELGIRCGELLVKAKALCEHGTWLDWLRNNFEGSERTAQAYMQMHRKRSEIRAKYASVADLGISDALREIAGADSERLPLPERERTIVERARDELDMFIPSFPTEYRDGSPIGLEDHWGFVAELAWKAMITQARRFAVARLDAQEATVETGSLPLEAAERMVEQGRVLEWWVGEVEWIETLVSSCYYPAGRGMPDAALDEELKHLPLSDLYHRSDQYWLVSPREVISGWMSDDEGDDESDDE